MFQVEDRATGKLKTIEPCVPFQSELLPANGSDRERLAAWVTDPHNQRFSQAIANRVWALMFGRGLVEPIDDLRSEPEIPPALEILADDFATHGFNLRRMITVISSSQVFQLDSRSDPAKPENETPADEITPSHEEAWAVFPIRRLRPEQVVGAINQASSLTTLDQDSHLVLRDRVEGRGQFCQALRRPRGRRTSRRRRHHSATPADDERRTRHRPH